MAPNGPVGVVGASEVGDQHAGTCWRMVGHPRQKWPNNKVVQTNVLARHVYEVLLHKLKQLK